MVKPPSASALYEINDRHCSSRATEEPDFAILSGDEPDCVECFMVAVAIAQDPVSLDLLEHIPSNDGDGAEPHVELLPLTTFDCSSSSWSSSSVVENIELGDENTLPSATTNFPFSCSLPYLTHHVEMIEQSGWSVNETYSLMNTRTLADFGIELEDGVPMPDGIVF